MLPLRLVAELQRTHQVIDHATVRSLGIDNRELQRFIDEGDLVRVRRGAYCEARHWARLTTPNERELVKAVAASRRMREPHVFSHDSAAHVLGLNFLMPEDPFVHVTRPGIVGARHHTGVKQHTADHDPIDVVITPFGPALGLARTACDLARQHGFRTGVSACDAVLRMGVEREELRRVAATMAYWRGVRTVRESIAFADAGAENPAESLTRILVAECGYGWASTQFPVQLDGRVVWSDLRVGTHLIEFDGRLKYRRIEDGGVAAVDAGEVVWRERQRERELLARGLGVSRVVWADLTAQRWDATRARLTREIGETWARVGHDLPPALRAFADRMAAARAARLRPIRAA